MRRETFLRFALVVVAAAGTNGSGASACPFCTALKPTLSQQRESAAVVAIGEVVDGAAKQAAEKIKGAARAVTVELRQVLSGKDRAAAGARISATCDATCRAGDLALLFATADASPTPAAGTGKPLAPLTWTMTLADESALAYFAKAPTLRTAADQRLKYFVQHLEHRNATIAEDAYQEFGHARYEDVVQVRDALPFDRLRTWAVDREIPQHRRGFYAAALSLATKEDVRRENLRVIERLIAEPADDVRAGFDGVLGALLLLRGEEGLRQLVARYTADSKSRDGDVRHALAALRFYWEYGREIPRAKLPPALHPLLDRPEFASTASIDLARWEDWSVRDKVVALYDRTGYPQPATRNAVVAYLKACPQSEATAALSVLRERDPTGVSAAEQSLDLGGLRAQ